MRYYQYSIMGNDCYIVRRVDDSLPKGERYKEYLVDLKRLSCDCKHFQCRKTACKHMKQVLAMLKDKGSCLHFEDDLDKLFKR